MALHNVSVRRLFLPRVEASITQVNYTNASIIVTYFQFSVSFKGTFVSLNCSKIPLHSQCDSVWTLYAKIFSFFLSFSFFSSSSFFIHTFFLLLFFFFFLSVFSLFFTGKVLTCDSIHSTQVSCCVQYGRNSAVALPSYQYIHRKTHIYTHFE